MNAQQAAITWEAPEHTHAEKKGDWFWIVGIFIIAGALSSIFLGNTLLGILIFVGGAVMLILAARPAKMIAYAVTQRGLRIDDTLYPYTTLKSFYIDENNPGGTQLLVASEKMFMPLLILPLPEEYIDDIEEIISSRLPETHLEEPFVHKLLEFFGF